MNVPVMTIRAARDTYRLDRATAIRVRQALSRKACYGEAAEGRLYAVADIEAAIAAQRWPRRSVRLPVSMRVGRRPCPNCGEDARIAWLLGGCPNCGSPEPA